MDASAPWATKTDMRLDEGNGITSDHRELRSITSLVAEYSGFCPARLGPAGMADAFSIRDA